jgi:hypothetical protein
LYAMSKYALALQNTLETDWKSKPLEQANKFGWEAIAVQYKVVIDDMLRL